MNPSGWVLFSLNLLGGLALFLFAIRLMTESLQTAAGPALHRLLHRATRGRANGFALGTGLGFLLHSSAATVLIVGFLNAGLLSLAQSIPPILGANLGTTLSMQLISFKIGAYYFVPILLGVVLTLASRRPGTQATGKALVGFGLLFLGMNLMSGAVAPHRDVIQPWLAAAHRPDLVGQLAAVGVGTAVTIAIQSSGAVIGILFALIGAEVFHDLSEVFPLLLGAHIGTCTTALLGSIGTTITARRGAFAHLLFNIVITAAALAAGPILLRAVAATSPDLIRQTANLHTAVMLGGALLILPIAPLFARLVVLLSPSRQPIPPGSHLQEDLLDKPEQAISAAIRELQRVARICRESFHLNAGILFKMDRSGLLAVRRNEEAIDEIRRAMRHFLAALTHRYLSRRQAILLQHLDRCMIDIERIGDHNDNLADLAEERMHGPSPAIPADAQQQLFTLFQAADHVLDLIIRSLDPERTDFHAAAREILQARDTYAGKSLDAKAHFAERSSTHAYSPIIGILLSEVAASCDRIVRHAKMIALVESQPWFWIKREKLDRIAPEMPPPPGREEEPHDFLDKLQSEGFV